MIITKRAVNGQTSDIGMWTHVIGVDGNQIKKAMVLDTDSMTCQVRVRRRMEHEAYGEFRTEKVASFYVRDNAPEKILAFSRKHGFTVRSHAWNPDPPLSSPEQP